MSWWLWGALFLLTMGFAKAASVVLNRLLVRPQSKLAIGLTELTQFSLIPLYTFCLFRDFTRIDSQQQSTVPFWELMTPFGMILASLGVIGFLLLIYSTIAYQSYCPPRCQISDESQIIDFRQKDPDNSWQTSLVGPRPMRRVALLPGNEQFMVEVSTKTYTLPRLPKEWDGLSIVQLADTHFRGAVTRKYFEQVCEQAQALKPDLFIFTGDLLDDQSLLDWLPETFGRLKAPLGQYFILGNHDWHLDPAAIREEFERNGWIDLAERSIPIASPDAGSAIFLAGDESPWMGTHPTLPPESNPLFRILVSHTPDNITWAREQGIDLMFAGHTHGGQIRLPIIGPVYSPSRFGCRFASGVFWLEPTLMYVSRGLSGREPIRYQCVPELIKLVLRTQDTV